jgi:hypothetical protein
LENSVRLWPDVTEKVTHDPGSSKTEGRHALNVEIEVRVLVPELEGG